MAENYAPNSKFHRDQGTMKGILYNQAADEDGSDNRKGKRMGYDARTGAEAPFGLVQTASDERYGEREVHLNRDKKDISTKVTSVPYDTSAMYPQRDQIAKRPEQRDAPFGQYAVSSEERYGDKVYVRKGKSGEVSGKVNVIDQNAYTEQLESKAKALAAGRKQAAGSGIFGA